MQEALTATGVETAFAPLDSIHNGARRPASPIFGIAIDLAQPAELLRTITGWAAEGQTRRVMYVNAHVVNQSHGRDDLDTALRAADLVYVPELPRAEGCSRRMVQSVKSVPLGKG